MPLLTALRHPVRTIAAGVVMSVLPAIMAAAPSSPADARQWVETTDRLRTEDRAVWIGWLEQVGR